MNHSEMTAVACLLSAAIGVVGYVATGNVWYLVGIGIVVLGLAGHWLAIRAYYAITLWWGPSSYPPCRRGKCSGEEDYRLDEFKNGEWVQRCRCGDRYVLRKRRFMEVLPDGSMRPYLRHAWLGRTWNPDEE